MNVNKAFSYKFVKRAKNRGKIGQIIEKHVENEINISYN